MIYRLWLYKALGKQALQFDLGYLESFIRNFETWFNENTAKDFLNCKELVMGEDDVKNAVRSSQQVYHILKDFMNVHIGGTYLRVNINLY